TIYTSKKVTLIRFGDVRLTLPNNLPTCVFNRRSELGVAGAAIDSSLLTEGVASRALIAECFGKYISSQLMALGVPMAVIAEVVRERFPASLEGFSQINNLEIM